MEAPVLNDDVTMEVLSRLSAKELYESKCVSKGWNSLISNPSFIRMHYYSQQSKETSGLFIQSSPKQLHRVDRPVTYIPLGKGYAKNLDTLLEFLPEKVILLASCNGLLCCRSCMHREKYPEEHPPRVGMKRKSPSKELVIYVCNPATKEWITILRPTGCRAADTIGLAFYPFGSSSSSSNCVPCFKLVSIQRSKSNRTTDTYSFVVYSSETGRWKTSKQVCHCNYEIIDKNREFFIGQRFHWLTMNHHIITFDVERELSGVIELPCPIMMKGNRTCLGSSEGHLHYVCVDNEEFKVWMLKDYFKPEWVLKCHLTMFDFCEEHRGELSYHAWEIIAGNIYLCGRLMKPLLIPLAFYEDVLFMNLDKWLYSYNFKTRSLVKHFPLFMVQSSMFVGANVLPYSVCLAAAGVLREYGREGSMRRSNGDLSDVSSPRRPKGTTRKP